MNKLFSGGLISAALLISTHASFAWGVKGHELVNGKAVDTLQNVAPPLYEFYAVHRDYLVKHASDPDEWRRFDKTEGPRHFIDMDSYGSEPPFPALPHSRAKADKLFGKKFVEAHGIVPWNIEHRYRLLVKAFRDGDEKEILKQSAALGHYAGDVHVPFHASENYDGQKTGNKGIHARFESEMLNRSISESDVTPRAAFKITKIVDAAFGWACDSVVLCAQILQMDTAATAIDPKFGDAYYNYFTPQARPIALKRLNDAATDLGSLYYSAWLLAGKPAL